MINNNITDIINKQFAPFLLCIGPVLRMMLFRIWEA